MPPTDAAAIATATGRAAPPYSAAALAAAVARMQLLARVL
jgi:hypothetical protein